jgi:hypothetical protein
VARRRKKRASRSSGKRAGKKDNTFLVIVAVLAVLAVVFYLASGGEPGEANDWVDEWEPILKPGETKTVAAQDYYGYVVEGYTLLIEVNGQQERVEILSLNLDETVDLVFNRRNYNVEAGETIMGDFDGDGRDDVALTLEGVVPGQRRFSMTLTHFANY